MIGSFAQNKNRRPRRRRRIVGILKPVAATGSPLGCTRGGRARSRAIPFRRPFLFRVRGKICSAKGETRVENTRNGQHSAPVLDVNSSPGTWKSIGHEEPLIDYLLTAYAARIRSRGEARVYTASYLVYRLFFPVLYPSPRPRAYHFPVERINDREDSRRNGGGKGSSVMSLN